MGFYTKEDKHVCPVETALDFLSGKWKARILWKLHQQTMRFGELRRSLPGITEKMLAQQLRDLERTNLVTRKSYPEVPPKVEYSLSEFGASLKPVLEMIANWGMNNQERVISALEKQNESKAADDK